MNLHTPERGTTESRDDYQARRREAKKFVARITLRGPIALGKSTSREIHRDALRSNGNMRKHAGAYGRGLRNWINSQNGKRAGAA